jgi:hypothetical protein
MAKMFLLNESIDENIAFQDFQTGLDDLILIEGENNDTFYKNEKLFILKNYSDLYQQGCQENQVRAQYIEQLSTLDLEPNSFEDLSNYFPHNVCGFYGISFPQLAIEQEHCINDDSSFKEFKKQYPKKINNQNFTNLKTDCFPNIIFCDKSVEQMLSFGNGKYFKQCLDQFIILEEYLKLWKKGEFNYQDLNENTQITLSPESKSTMGKYANERRFALPDSNTDIFELHIKLGDIRIHILEDNKLKKIMIGYIGSHLSI